jgi:cytochrome c553
MRVKLTRWLGIAGVLAAAGLALALLVAYSGVVNIAASAGHPVLIERFLELGMTRSIQHHSRNIAVPNDLDSIDRIRLGAAHFAGGCAECHGAPGSPGNPVYQYMLPPPPDLTRESERWNTAELFFIVRNGLQFTGMPEWSGGDQVEEVWSMVAFLQKLPTLETAEYLALAAGNLGAPSEPGVDTLRQDGITALARAACDRCHDTAQAPPPSQLVPRLAGQPAAYLARSLREYQRGERRSGFMQPVAATLSEGQIEQLALHYSQMPAAPPADAALSLAPAQQTAATLLASGNDPMQRLPACLSCHGNGARADYPQLQGQQAAYLAQQLRRFRDGERQHSAWGQVMTVIATHLQPAKIDLLAQWFSQQPSPATVE